MQLTKRFSYFVGHSEARADPAESSQTEGKWIGLCTFALTWDGMRAAPGKQTLTILWLWIWKRNPHVQTVGIHSGCLKEKEEFNGKTLKFHWVDVTVRDQEHSGLDSKNQMVHTSLFSLNKWFQQYSLLLLESERIQSSGDSICLVSVGKKRKTLVREGFLFLNKAHKYRLWVILFKAGVSCCWWVTDMGSRSQKTESNHYPDKPH